MFSFFGFFNRRTAPIAFERAVVSFVVSRITDSSAISSEIESAWKLIQHRGSSDERRESVLARHYFVLEEHIATGQSKNRLSREELREDIAQACHPERADGGFALLFLTSYARRVRLFELFISSVFGKARALLGDKGFGEVLAAVQKIDLIGGSVVKGAFLWNALDRALRKFDPARRVTEAERAFSAATLVLAEKLLLAVDRIRTEQVFAEAYHELRGQLDFLDDVPAVLHLVPKDFLSEERIELLGKSELQSELRQKSQELEMSITNLEAEHAKLSTMTREELEARVEERTAELLHALEDVKTSRANLQEFTSLATHELRAPVGIIKGYASLLLDGSVGTITEQQKKFVGHMKEACERLIELINAMLNASRIELGTLAIEPEPVYLPDLANKVLTELAPQIDEKHMTVTKQFDDKTPIVNVDPRLLRSVFQNLLSNAVKYTPEAGEISFSIEKNGSDILITVRDTGYGIPKEQQSKIFTKLFRADNVRVKQIEGTGLGLFIVKSVVEESGGKIWFASPAPGAEKSEHPGAAFYVTVPLAGMHKKEGIKGLS